MLHRQSRGANWPLFQMWPHGGSDVSVFTGPPAADFLPVEASCQGSVSTPVCVSVCVWRAQPSHNSKGVGIFCLHLAFIFFLLLSNNFF